MSRLQSGLLFLLFLLSAGSPGHAEEIICRYCNRDDSPFGATHSHSGRFQYAPVRQVDVQHIKLDVTPNFEAKTVSGTVSITAIPISQPVEVLRLDAVDIHVQEVRLAEGEVADFLSMRDRLEIAFAEPLPVGKEFRVEIEYSAQPTQGLYFRTADMGYPEADTHIWTQGETHEARHWFPCFDYPNERSSTEIICHVPSEMTVLSNGRRMGETTDDSGLKAVRWLQKKPHANYLICLVAGKFEKLEKRHRDLELGFYTQPTLIEHAANSFLDTPDIMAFFESDIGMPFPWAKYDQVTIADFVAGGMENTSITTLTDQTVFSSETENIRSTRSLDAHELAHQWFGDYVTCKDWSHLWLNEGFATYYATLYEGHKFGRDALLYRMYLDASQKVLVQAKDMRPIVYNEYKNPGEQFDFRAYPKGSWVLHMLRSQLGDDLYRECILAYLKKHALSNVVTDDLRQVIEEHTGRPMDRFFDQWVYHPRHPDLKITYQWLPKSKMAKVTIRQTQTISDDVLLYEFPTQLRFVVGNQVIDRDITVKDVEEDFYVPLESQPSIVRFDPAYSVLASVDFDKSNDLLAAQIANEEDMIGRLIACEALGSRKTDASVQLLKTRLNEDPFFGVRIAAAKALARHHSDKAIRVLNESFRGQTDARVRLAVAEAMFKRFQMDDLRSILSVVDHEKNPAIRAVAIKAMGKYYGEPARSKLIELLDSESFRDELAAASIEAIRKQNDPSFAPALLQMLDRRASKMSSRNLAKAIETVGEIAKDSDQQSIAFEWIVSTLDHPKTKIQTAAIAALGDLGDRRSKSIIAAYLDSNDERMKRAAEQAMNKLNEQAATVPQEVIELRKSLQDLQKETKEMKKDFEAFQKRYSASNSGSNDSSEPVAADSEG
ncbi:Aminopeptidase N [Novipirellula aureliae]|uniref:Aminopeptidase N n=1 Tax=Novipirellula aureliae TaxID=2527966 RepID=A0A5C6DGM2_9BACT|nr:M1 family aminopeptidase [Novipirellula aureliae]TWU34129.1 Aminopeptidase N [Novipirellula aureliae]